MFQVFFFHTNGRATANVKPRFDPNAHKPELRELTRSRDPAHIMQIVARFASLLSSSDKVSLLKSTAMCRSSRAYLFLSLSLSPLINAFCIRAPYLIHPKQHSTPSLLCIRLIVPAKFHFALSGICMFSGREISTLRKNDKIFESRFWKIDVCFILTFEFEVIYSRELF